MHILFIQIHLNFIIRSNLPTEICCHFQSSALALSSLLTTSYFFKAQLNLVFMSPTLVAIQLTQSRIGFWFRIHHPFSCSASCHGHECQQANEGVV